MKLMEVRFEQMELRQRISDAKKRERERKRAWKERREDRKISEQIIMFSCKLGNYFWCIQVSGGEKYENMGLGQIGQCLESQN